MGLEFFGHLLAWANNGLALIYWGIGLWLLWRIWRAKWARWQRIAAALAVGLPLIGWPLSGAVKDYRLRQAAEARLARAEAIFAERCKSAGEKIYRTVENVEGILLLKLRPAKYYSHDQNAVDPYGYDYDGIGEPYGNEGYIGSFLRARNREGHLINDLVGVTTGYHYIEVVEDGKRYRYTGQMWKAPNWVRSASPVLRLKREPAPGPTPAYGVTYDDITTAEERAMWIAASSLKVIDLQTKEVIAERIGYMIDKGQGNKGGGRQPWAYARDWACPKYGSTGGHTRNFVEKVVKIKQGEDK